MSDKQDNSEIQKIDSNYLVMETNLTNICKKLDVLIDTNTKSHERLYDKLERDKDNILNKIDQDKESALDKIDQKMDKNMFKWIIGLLVGTLIMSFTYTSVVQKEVVAMDNKVEDVDHKLDEKMIKLDHSIIDIMEKLNSIEKQIKDHTNNKIHKDN